MKTILQTFQLVAELEGITITKLESTIGASKGVLSKAILKESDIQSKWLLKLVENYPEYNPTWLLTGLGDPFVNTTNDYSPNHLDASSHDISLMHSLKPGEVSNMLDAQTLLENSELYKDATAVFRYSGGSMIEYSADSVLFLKEVVDQSIIFWGNNYLIETNEGKIVRRLQKGDSDEYILGISTSEDTYNRGHIINETLVIPKKSIKRLYLILGCLKREFNP